MELVLRRSPATGDAILGELFVDHVFECWTLERAGVEIPIGRYRIDITPSAHFGRVLPLVEHVPGRAGIRIHAGNYPIDTDGCILVGQSLLEDGVGRSKLALGVLQTKLAAALARQEDVWIRIDDATPAPRTT